MGDKQIVWVAEKGCYSDRFVTGVYVSAEAGMAHNHRSGEHWVPDTSIDINPTPMWDNGLDWDSAVSLYPYRVEGDNVILTELVRLREENVSLRSMLGLSSF